LEKKPGAKAQKPGTKKKTQFEPKKIKFNTLLPTKCPKMQEKSFLCLSMVF